MKRRNTQELVQNCQHSRLRAALMSQMPQVSQPQRLPSYGSNIVLGEVAALREAPEGSDTRFYTNFLLLTGVCFVCHFMAQVASF